KDRIIVVCGQSGVGKSSLLNSIDETLDIQVNEISKALGRGKHTTRHVELHKLSGGLIADTPGFSSLDLDQLEATDLSECFIDFYELSDQCKFRGCVHEFEPNCAVKRAVENHEVLSSRYDNYLQFLTEIKSRKPKY
ncbi:ribosome small subunit-dependent GTPase A, partial [Turicibacter sanguinis]